MDTKILIIEDNLEMRENIQEILELSGYDVSTAENGKIGAKMAISLIPNLIICDIMMPEMDGFETLYVLNKNKKTSSIPFVFLTAKSERSDWRKGMNLGADDYLMKPFDEMELLRVVETRLKKRDSLQSSLSEGTGDLNEFISNSSSLNEFKEVCATKPTIQIKKKEYVFREGDTSNSLFFIKNGKIRTSKINMDSKEYTTGLFKPSDFFGAKSLLQKIPHPESAIALEDSEIVRIHKDDFLSLIYSNRKISTQFISILSGLLIQKEEELLNLAYNSVRKRVADSLLTLFDRYSEKDEDVFSISIPRDSLASIVGTSTESVIRVLSDFKQEKLIDIKVSNIKIINLPGLKKIK